MEVTIKKSPTRIDQRIYLKRHSGVGHLIGLNTFKDGVEFVNFPQSDTKKDFFVPY